MNTQHQQTTVHSTYFQYWWSLEGQVDELPTTAVRIAKLSLAGSQHVIPLNMEYPHITPAQTTQISPTHTLASPGVSSHHSCPNHTDLTHTHPCKSWSILTSLLPKPHRSHPHTPLQVLEYPHITPAQTTSHPHTPLQVLPSSLSYSCSRTFCKVTLYLRDISDPQ